MGDVRRGSRRRRRGLAAVAIGLVTGCATGSGAAITPAPVTAARSTPPTPTGLTVAPPSAAAGTVAPPTSAVPTSPDLLAGGMVLCAFSGSTLPRWAIERLEGGLSAGLLLFRRNLTSEVTAAANGQAAQRASMASPVGLPAIVATDQEGGIVSRIEGPPTGSAAAMGARAPAEVEAEGRATADLLHRWGVNTDLAPVADVARPDSFEARGRRSFSADPAIAGTAVSAFVAGLRQGGVAATLKHFPGLGAAAASTDHANGVVDVPLEELTAVDLVPFRRGIDAGAELVMVASAAYPALSPGLALTSPTVIDGVLRGQLGYEGVIVSDALDADGVRVVGTPAEAAVAAAAAGVDLLITKTPKVCLDVHRTLVAAMADGRLPVARAQEAFGRVAALRRSLLPGPAG